MSVTTRFGLSLAALGAVGMGALWIPGAAFMPACSPAETSGSGGSSSGSPSAPMDGSTNAYCGSPKGACCATAGQAPNPECDDGDETQCAATTCAAVTTPNAECGSFGTASAPSCEPLANNTASPYAFRMRRLIVVAPPKLATSAVQQGVVTNGVDMLEPQCAEEGSGLFNWLLSFDASKNTLTTGGAPQCDTTGTPACDPYTTGYCFVNKNVNGIQVGPSTGAIAKASDGTWGSTTPIPALNIPIYYASGTAAPTIILLPISNAAIEGVKISADNNCIGSVNTQALTAACSDLYQNCSKWLTDGSLTGYITLKTANSVQVSLLSRTLCSLLTGDTSGPPLMVGTSSFQTCAVDANGNPTAKGDYCSTTSSAAAGNCQDSFWLAATFAASAVKINDGTGVPDCTGGTAPSDAGGD